MGLGRISQSNMQVLANKTGKGDFEILANRIIDFFVSVSEHLPRLDINDDTFEEIGELPDKYVIRVVTTFDALWRVKVNKATGPGDIPAWIIRKHAVTLAEPLTAIFNNSPRTGV